MSEQQERRVQLAKRLALPIVLGLVTIGGVHHYLTRQIQALDEQAQLDMVSRVVAASALSAGTSLSFEHLSLRSMPQTWVSPDSFQAEQAQALEGMVLLEDVVAGQPLTRSVLASPKPRALSEQLAPGRRAVTIPVDHVSSLSGRLEAGDVIDLYVTFTHQGQRVTTLLVNAVRVLATDRPLVDNPHAMGESSVTSVTLDVSSKQAVKLVSANQGGVLTAVLTLDRANEDSGLRAEGLSAAQANHLAGFVGLAPSLGAEQTPIIIYGDITAAPEQMP
jgi:pilus assembly protein CpaB